MNTYIHNKNFIYASTLLLCSTPLHSSYKYHAMKYGLPGLAVIGFTAAIPAAIGMASRIYAEEKIGLFGRVPGAEYDIENQPTSIVHDLYQGAVVGSLLGAAWFGVGMYFANDVRIASCMAVPYFSAASRSLVMDSESNLYRRCRYLLPTAAIFMALSRSIDLQNSLPILSGAFVLSAAINLMTVGT